MLLAVMAFAADAFAAPTITEYPVPTHDRQPLGIAAGPDGNVWFTESVGSGAIGRSTVAGSITEFTSGLSGPAQSIVAGPDGNLWFTEPSSNKIGRITTSGAITEYSTKGIEPANITAGPDGNLWFTEPKSNKIARITTSGAISEFSSGLTTKGEPTGITAGPDGNLWFTEPNGNKIGRITTSGTITEFSSGLTANSEPAGITAGPDGNLWFTEIANPGRVGRITTSGTITEFTSGLTTNVEPDGITGANDGNVYFAEPFNLGKIGEITPGGSISEHATPTSFSFPEDVASGPDGNLWFTEAANPGRIGMMTIAPKVGTTSASGVAETIATLEASVGPNSQATTYDFEYGTTTAYGAQTSAGSAGSGAGAATVSAPVGGLTPATPYHFRAVATNGTGTTYGPDQTFTTIAPPTAISQPASSVMLTSAILNGTVNPQGHATTYHFDWGPTTSYGSQLPEVDASVGADSAKHQLEQELTGLSADHTYHFRVVATNCGGCTEGTTYGADQTFTTAAPPTATTEGAEAIELTSATVTGTVNPRGAAATYHFDWGETTAYGNQSPVPDQSAGSDSVSHELGQSLTGLHAGTAYHYRIVATNCGGCVAGTAYGADQTFTTVPAPTASTQGAQSLTLTGATVTGAVNPEGTATTYHFDWGETTAYGNQSPVPDQSAGSDSVSHELGQSLTGLHAGTVYHYRIVATNCGGCVAGTAYGVDQTFTTVAAPAVSTDAAQAVALTSATMTATVNPRGTATTYHFDWGETAAYGGRSPLADEAVGSDSATHEVSRALTGLTPGTGYHYRVVASDCEGCAAGTSYGADTTFTTASEPLLADQPASSAAGLGFGPARPGPAPAAVAPPVLGTTALTHVLGGTVLVRVHGSSALQPLSGTGDVPIGTLVDAVHGRLVLTTAVDRSGDTQSATVWGATFLVGQSASRHGMTTFTLVGSRPRGCSRRGHRGGRVAVAGAAARHKPAHSLWAKDHGGHYSTRGQNSVATVRGTYWGTVELCRGTETIVRSGTVSVRPLHRHRAVLVRAGHSYLARP